MFLWPFIAAAKSQFLVMIILVKFSRFLLCSAKFSEHSSWSFAMAVEFAYSKWLSILFESLGYDLLSFELARVFGSTSNLFTAVTFKSFLEIAALGSLPMGFCD